MKTSSRSYKKMKRKASKSVRRLRSFWIIQVKFGLYRWMKRARTQWIRLGGRLRRWANKIEAIKISFQGNELVVDERRVSLPYPIQDALEDGERIYVLYNFDAFLKDPAFKVSIGSEVPSVRNLVALTKDGSLLWEAEFPETSDYYYNVVSVEPLVANSFSSYACEIDPRTGRITRTEFYK